MELRKGIEQAGAEIVKELNKLAEPIEGKSERVAEVATISAGDAEIGKLIAGVIEKVGKDGVVTVEAGQGLELEAEVVEGFSLDKGWVSPFFVTDTGRQEAVYEKPAILITDKKISNVQEFLLPGHVRQLPRGGPARGADPGAHARVAHADRRQPEVHHQLPDQTALAVGLPARGHENSGSS